MRIQKFRACESVVNLACSDSSMQNLHISKCVDPLLFSNRFQLSQQTGLEEIPSSQSLIYELERLLNEFLIECSCSIDLEDPVHPLGGCALVI